MLSADSDLQTGSNVTSSFDREGNKPSDTVNIQHLERVVLKNPPVKVIRKEPSRVVSAEPEGGLGQIIGPKGEERRGSGYLSSGQGCPGELDHGPHRIRDFFLHPAEHLLSDLFDDFPLVLEFAVGSYQRNHDFRTYIYASAF